MTAILLSVVIPALDEADNLIQVVPEVSRVLETLSPDHEIYVIDDGSRDGTAKVMGKLRENDQRIHCLQLRRNLGKSGALQVGFEHVQGTLVVTLDADGQDDIESVPAMIAMLDDGYDLVTGYRLDRNDRLVKRVTSRFFNWAVSKLGGVYGRDFNSGLKVMRLEVAQSLQLYGELHRYVPVLANWLGFQTTEMEVPHHSRIAGTSKFGHNRFWRGFLDLVTVKFLTTYTGRPFHLFGGLGALLGLAGGAILTWMTVLKAMGRSIGGRPAVLAGVLLLVVAVQLVSLGLLAEMLVHFRSTRGSRFPIRRID